MAKYIPSLYYSGQMSLSCNDQVFMQYFFLGVCQALVVFFVPLYTFHKGIANQNGDTDDLWLLSVTSFTSLVFVATINLAVTTRAFNPILTAAFVIPSILFYLGFMWTTNWYGDKLENSILHSHHSPLFYLTVILCVGLCFVVDYFLHGFTTLAIPTPSQYIRRVALT